MRRPCSIRAITRQQKWMPAIQQEVGQASCESDGETENVDSEDERGIGNEGRKGRKERDEKVTGS